MLHKQISIANGGRIEKPPAGNRSSLFIRTLKIYSDVQRVPSARTKADNDIRQIAPTSCLLLAILFVMAVLIYSILSLITKNID